MRHLFHRVNSTALAAILLGLLVTLFFVHISTPSAIAAQTREQCDRCCEKAGHDEYYLEQCKLKCFRNPDHCSGGKAAQSPAPATAPSPRTVAPPSAQPKADVPPAAQPRATPPGPPAQPKAAFRFPDSLSLVPGREQEAAGQILALNGISPQHPNFPAALAAVQGILVEFARANPAGGRLPTAQLERTIRQFRQ
ncbi:MAG: hypothetical protein AB1646_25245 [Thermodesulfobacteriota bacterium]